MFGHDSLPSKIFAYAAEPPDCEALVIEQMRLANRYRNDLVAIELQRRGRTTKAELEFSEELAALTDRQTAIEENIDLCRKVISRRNAQSHKRTGQAEERERIADLRQQLGVLRARQREIRVELRSNPTLLAQREAIDSEATEHIHNLRAANSDVIYWGTRGAVENAVQAAKKKPTLRFRSWRGEGKVAVQVQKGKKLSDYLRLQLATRDDDTAAVAYVRVQSTDKGKPVWARVPFVYQRPLPTNGAIKWVYLIRRKEHGTHWKWYLQLVVACAEGFPRETIGTGVVGVDLGWRERESGLRVAYWATSEYDHGELVLPVKDCSRWEHANRLRSIRDRLFDGMRETLVRWLEGHAEAPDWLEEQADWYQGEANKQLRLLRGESKESRRCHRRREAEKLRNKANVLSMLSHGWLAHASDIPYWLTERTQRLRSWRSTARLASLVLFWRENRFSGDGLIHPVLEVWQHNDRHLLDWEQSEREKAVRWRDDLFRNFAVDLSRRYEKVVVESVNIRDLQRRCQPEEVKNRQALRIDNGHIAAVGKLREFLKQSFQSEFLMVDAAKTTLTCWRCGHDQEFDRRDLVRRCDECGAEDDQDFNAAMRLLLTASDEVMA